jgi:hypothetical protein
VSDDPRERRAKGTNDALETVEETLAAAGGAIRRAGREIVPEAVETISAAGGVISRAGHALRKTGAKRRQLQRRAREPLPLLYDVHPEARRALPHPLGLRTIPLAEIAGSAVEPPQRGGDFLPLAPFRSSNWGSRWQRLRSANDRLAHLPPIDVLRYGARYWVTDGHNRVALGLYEDQVGIDANVTELHLPGQPIERAGDLAPLLEEAREAGPSTFVRDISAEDLAPPEAQEGAEDHKAQDDVAQDDVAQDDVAQLDETDTHPS